MRKKWMNYLVTTSLVFLIIVDFKNLSTITITCLAMAIALNLYDIFKDIFKDIF
ncbi:hypothetical protein ACLGL2_05680 [Parvimonas sp. G1641]|uniref:hypothetical protein n=1 Tax=Parvimonas sp. G1641 TaxID=3388846 RepID=UPI00398020C9